jgi:hypothetical protein
MVERLKDSLAGLEPPGCVNCGIETRWFMSRLVPQEPVTRIVHRFVCPGCEGIHEVEAEFKPVRVLPDKSTKSRRAAHAA